MNQRYIVTAFIPGIGCKSRCSFCNQEEITGWSSDQSLESIRENINQQLTYLPKEATKELAFYGGSFTAIPKSFMKDLLSLGKELQDEGLIASMRCSTRPDAIDESILDLLKIYGMNTVELGIQSMCETVLRKNRRYYTVETIEKSISLLKGYEFTIGLQMMTGLYQSTMTRDWYTLKKLLQFQSEFLRIYPTIILKNTELEVKYYNKEYRPRSLQEEVDFCAKLLALCLLEHQKVIRCGLHADESLLEDDVIIAGPYHPAFRQMAEGRLYGKVLEYLIYDSGNMLEIFAPQGEINKWIGYGAENKKKLLKLGFRKVKFYPSDTTAIFIDGINCYTTFQFEESLKRIVLEAENEFKIN